MLGLRFARSFCTSSPLHSSNALRSFSTRSIAARPFTFGRAAQHSQARFASTASLGKSPWTRSTKSKLFPTSKLGVGTALASLGFGFAAFQIQKPVVLCDAPTNPSTAPARADPTPMPMRQDDDTLPPPPRSSLNMLELSFGTVAGICAGVFIKKGAKALAFVLGGVFVLLQYFVSVRLVRVNWSSLEKGYDAVFHSSSTDATGKEVHRTPTVYSLFRWMIDFLTADFPPRATFIAGVVLGLRIG